MPSINRSRPDTNIQQQQLLSRQIAAQQTAVATGIRVSRPSDDPAAWSQISSAGNALSNIATWLGNIDSVRATAAQVEDSLSHISANLVRAKELTIQAASASVGDAARTNIAAELRAIHTQISEILQNRDAQGQRLFPDAAPLMVPIGQESLTGGQMSAASFDPILSGLNRILLATESGTDAERSDSLVLINTVIDTLSARQTDNGLVQLRLDSLEQQHEEHRLVQTDRLSVARDADLSSSISIMQKLMVNLQAAQASYTRIAQSSLFDFLR